MYVFIPEILDDFLYLYNVNAVRHSYLYESSLGAREAQKKTEKDINTCFYSLNYLECKRGMKFIRSGTKLILELCQRGIRFLRGGTFDDGRREIWS